MGALVAIVLEAETGRLSGLTVSRERPGYSGTGYVTGFEDRGHRVDLEFDAPAGLYEVTIRYSLPGGEKGFEIAINGEKRSGMLTGSKDGWHETSGGKVRLVGGTNRITVHEGWGWWDLDRVTLTPASPTRLLPVPAKLADPKADPAATALLRRLTGLYGTKILAGQTEQKEIEYVRSVTGKTPAMGVFDFMDCSPSRVARGANGMPAVESALAFGKAGGVVQMMWHWNAPGDLIDSRDQPWWRGFYTQATTFDLAKALSDPNSEPYRPLISDLDSVVPLLKRFQSAGLPVLWRPLHEAQGGWFWWGAKGPKAFKALWRLMFDRYTKHHGLHHLLWVYGPPAGGVAADDWYPGDDVVDAIGPSIYADATSSMSVEWEALFTRFNGKKIIGLSECGSPPDLAAMRALGVRWAWFAPWSGDFIRKTPADRLTSVYADPEVVTRDLWIRIGAAR